MKPYKNINVIEFPKQYTGDQDSFEQHLANSKSSLVQWTHKVLMQFWFWGVGIIQVNSVMLGATMLHLTILQEPRDFGHETAADCMEGMCLSSFTTSLTKMKYLNYKNLNCLLGM